MEDDNMRNEFCLADAIHLHDQLLVITADAFTHGTDSAWAFSDEPEYMLNMPSDVIKRFLDQVGYTGRWREALGFARHYKEYPERPVDLISLSVRIVSDRLVEIKMLMQGEEKGQFWLESWTYSGAYTITWPAKEAPAAESQG